jgi:hypothetical protein
MNLDMETKRIGPETPDTIERKSSSLSFFGPSKTPVEHRFSCGPFLSHVQAWHRANDVRRPLEISKPIYLPTPKLHSRHEGGHHARGSPSNTRSLDIEMGDAVAVTERKDYLKPLPPLPNSMEIQDSENVSYAQAPARPV